jgi:diguanylate cyclase (GGDEF)-like protein
VGFVDDWTGYEISVSLLYLGPVLAAAWYAGWASCVLVSFSSVFMWHWADVHSGPAYEHAAIVIWNAFMRLGFFLTNGYFAAQFHIHLERERRMARQDALTRLMNSRAFFEEAERFFALLRRKVQPVTLVYIDLDNFKQVNDTRGHSEGDKVLCVVADALTRGTRHYDLVARLGGDEFGVMLPETDFGEAEGYVAKTREMLETAVARRGWPVSFSIGVVTFRILPETVDEALGAADALMYKVKRSGKNGVLHECWPSEWDVEAAAQEESDDGIMVVR